MSPKDRELLEKICTWATRGWTVAIRRLDVERVVCQGTLPTTTTTLWSLLPPGARRRMRAAAKRGRGVRLSVSEALDVQAGAWSAVRADERRQAAEAAS